MDINDINYVSYGKNVKGTIVLLHGWGQNIEMMDMLGKPFQDEFKIIILDLPGFGKSKEPNMASSVEDYGDILYTFLSKLKVKNPILIGHSFGGRISIYYAAKYGASKVVLLSSPFRPNTNTKVSNKTKIYKSVKKIKLLKPLANYLKGKWGSDDYKNASEINRGTLVKVVNEDLTDYAKNITCSTLLIYGTNDTAVDISEARYLVNILKDGGLVEYEGCTHYAYLERLNQTISVLNSFLR